MGKKMVVLIILCFTLGLFAQETGTPGAKVTEIAVRTVEPYVYVAVEMTGSYTQHEQAFSMLYQAAGTQGFMLSDYPMGIYYNSPDNTPEESLIWEVGVAVSGIDSVAAPLVLKKSPYTLIASVIYEGGFGDELMAVYGRLYGWIAQQGYQISGPMHEVFRTMPSQDASGNFVGELEIFVPVQKPE